MSSADNLAKLKEAYQLWDETKAGSVEHWMDLLDDSVKFRSLAHGSPGMEFSQDRSSKAEVVGYMEGLAADWDMLHYTTDQFIADGDWVAVLGRCGWRNKHTDKEIQTPKADFWRFKDGKIVAFYEFYDTAQVMAAVQQV